MSQHDERDRTIALAGVLQAAHLVTELARNGRCEAQAEERSLESLFEFDPASVEAVFGGLEGVSDGLRTLHKQLTQPAQRNLELTRYAVALIHHGDKLLKDRDRLSELGQELERFKEKRTLFGLSDTSQSAQLARLYQDHISSIEPRIMIRGEPIYLQNPSIAEQIRALLLAGIRAAVLWRQCKGQRWQLLLKRKKTAELTLALLDELP